MSVCDPDQAPVTILTPASYVADIEEFTLMLEHSIRGQASGVEIRSGNMEYGELIDSATGLAVKRWDDQIRALTSPTWYNKNDVSLMATAAGAVGSSSFQQWDPSASVLDAKLPWKSRPHKIAGDVMRVGDLLRAADIQLDTISESPMATRNETIRSAGVVIIVVIQYGAVGWNPNKISYRYMPKAIPDQEYKAVETIRDFQAGRRVEINRHGIKIVISQHGQLGKFSLMTLLTNLVAAVALFKVANILVELMMLRLHPQKVVYGQAKYDSTRGRVGGGGGGMGPVSGGHVKESFKDKDNSLADLQDSEDKPDYYDHRCSMTGDRTLRALGTHHAQHHSQTQQQDFTGARATTSSHDLITTSAHLRERTPRRGGEEEDDIIETRYGAISLSEIRSPGCVTRGFNPGRLVETPLMNVTGTSAKITPGPSSSSSIPPRSPADMAGTSPLPVCFGFSRHSSLDNLRDSSFSSPVSTQSPTLSSSSSTSSLSGTPSPTIAADSIASSNTSNGGRRTPRPSRILGTMPTMDGSQGGSHFGASSHQQQQIRTSAFKKLKKDTGSTSGHFGTDEYLLTIASPQALSARRVSSGSLFGSSSTSTSTAGRTFPFSSAFTFRSASADPLTDRKKKNSGGTRFVAEPSSFYGNGSAADAKGKSVAFDHSFNHGSNKMAGGIEWLSFYTDDSTNRPCLTSRGFGTATSSSLSSSTSSLHTESLGSGSDNLSSTPWSVFHYSQPPVYPTKSHIGVHPFDLDAWTRESKSRASSPLVGPYSTRPSPRLSVGPSPTPSPVSTSSSRPEGSRTLRTSTSMPLLFQSAAAVGSSSKLRNNSLVPSGSPSLLSSCSTVATNTTRDAQCEMQEKQLKDGTEDGEDEEEDEDEEELMASSAGSAVEKSGSTSSDRLSDPTNQQHDYPPSSSTATTQPSEQLQRNDSQPQSTSTHQSAASAFARPLPPLPPSTTTTATTSMITTTSHPRLSSGSSTVTHTISFALPPHPLLGSSYTTASRSMPSLVTKFRNGDERSAFSPTAAATTSAATTVMTMSTDLSTPSAGQSSTWTKTAHGLPSGGSSSSSSIHSHTDSHRDSGSSYNTSSAQSMLLQQQSKSQQQQQPQLRSPESPAASSVSSSPTYSTCTSFSQPSLSPPSSSSPPDSSSLSTGLLTSRSASNLHGATSTTAAVLPVPPPSFITPTTTKTMPPLSQSASAHMQHFQAQILKHQQKQLQQKQQQQQEQGQGQQQSPSQHQGIHGSHPLKRSESVVAPAASLFFSSPITMASTHVPPGSGVRMLSRTITMTTAENRKLVLCRSESLQLCEGVGEEKAARI
ncbi:cytochrome c oxidase subunit 1 [Actinomortierella ambigua]|nr:cytochrome c oxidase subunit 1 [Actinomortierella ambigua]